jgi:hypothetical protein
MARKQDSEETRRLKAKLSGSNVEPEDVEFEDVDSQNDDNFGDDIVVDQMKEEDLSQGAKISFNPLEGKPKSADRSYTKQTSNNNIESVEEAYTQPQVDLGGDKGADGKPNPINPETSSLNPDDQRRAAEAAFDISVSGYKMLFTIAQKGAKISDTQISDLVNSDKINLYVPVSISDEEGKVHLLPFKDVVEIFNKNVENTLTYSQEFIDNVREPVIKKFMEKGIGITDNNKIVYSCIIEVVRIGLSFWQLKKFGLSITKDAEEKYGKMKASGQVPKDEQQQQQEYKSYQQNSQQKPPPTPEQEITNAVVEEEPLREADEKISETN